MSFLGHLNGFCVFPRSLCMHHSSAACKRRFCVGTLHQVLIKVTERCRESYIEEKTLTLQALKRRPQGKKDLSHRSSLHDDITVVILQVRSPGLPLPSVCSLPLAADVSSRRGGLSS